jgi:hypothetical protein
MLDFIKVVIRPDKEEDPEASIVARAANILQVGEFQLLQLAYHDWYGQELPSALCDQLFQAYMLHDQIPIWARHYARHVIDLDASDLIEPNDPFYHRYDRDYVTHVPKGVRGFVLASMFLVTVLVGGLVMGRLTAGESSTLLPPYIDVQELPRPLP